MSGSEDDEGSRVFIKGLSPGDVALLKNVAKETAKETVREFSTAMGIDPDDPFAAQADMQWLRTTRKRAEGIHGKVLITAIGIAVTGAASTAWAGIKAMLGTGSIAH